MRLSNILLNPLEIKVINAFYTFGVEIIRPVNISSKEETLETNNVWPPSTLCFLFFNINHLFLLSLGLKV